MKWNLFLVLIAVLALSIGFGGCDNMRTPSEPETYISADGSGPIIDKSLKTNNNDNEESSWENSELINYKKGGVLEIGGAITLNVEAYSMNTSFNTRISASCEKSDDGRTLVFQFGPNGLCFEPQAQLELRWDKLGFETDLVNLYYFDSRSSEWVYLTNSYEQSDTHKWDKRNNRVVFKIPHFSLYSLSRD